MNYGAQDKFSLNYYYLNSYNTRMLKKYWGTATSKSVFIYKFTVEMLKNLYLSENYSLTETSYFKGFI